MEVNVVEPTDDEEAYMVGLIDKGRRVLDYDFEDPKVRAAKPSDSPCASKELSTHTNSSAKASECKENEVGFFINFLIVAHIIFYTICLLIFVLFLLCFWFLEWLPLQGRNYQSFG